MFFLFLFLFSGVQGSIIQPEIDVESICEKNPFKVCKPDNIMKSFPENKEEVDELCKILKVFQPCMLDYFGECGAERSLAPMSVMLESGIVGKLCNKESSLYNAFVENSACIGRVVNEAQDSVGRLCRDHKSRVREENPEALARIEFLMNEYQTEEKMALARCLWQTFSAGCLIKRVQECGASAQLFATRVIEQSKFVKAECTVEHLPIQQELLSVLDFKIEPKEETPLEMIFK